MAAANSTRCTEPTRVEMFDAYARFTGHADELIVDDLILPEWLPQGRKRKTHSADFPGGWWLHGEDFPDVSEYPTLQRLHAHLHRLEGWAISRCAGGRFELLLWPRYWRYFLGGPVNPDAAIVALEWHRRSVRARADAQFQRFMAAAIGA